ncbi:1-acyl-sn-glycerol-3-phosphate acyltransferase gamma [Nilaparvata lugens]|uniref:1-acyl-sn-glycerol-3-phosphate acyltransferase gamma n=1 Tax=Nilaparvata lugens TaxID=108931 RepID=UPI00193DA8B0|nr:1-acyl-sn-glycerol-3-phosphate acyltransferase gamma [Nilaparvata lugens]XP_039293294.1 1-acyl-sn-glycerol-3-phosphate acyltransferase gamma [Nilaparvata lugens]XP_039293295.1 1-acyl-sn-glycerol-3-phosphate acyltransferase gamma [Nilaparvata lugens]
MLGALKSSPIGRCLAFLMAMNFFLSGLVINAAQCVLYYGLRPFSKHAYRKVNYYLAYSLYSQLVFMAEWWSGTDVHIYIDKDDFDKYYGKEHGYLVMNHRYDVDWLVGWIFCDRIKVLGNCKAYAKKSIQYLPTMGYAWKFAESVFLERNWDKDREAIGTQVRELAQYPDPIWLLLFAEGTRFTEEKHAASLEFARKKGLPELRQHLTPRTKGFTCSVPHLRDKVPAVYDVQLAFKENSETRPTVASMLKGKPLEAHMYIERIPISQVPDDEEEAANWLRDLYLKKDKMMESFLRHGDWFVDSGVRRVEAFKLPRRCYSLLNVVWWGFVLMRPLLYFVVDLLASGSTFSIGVGVTVFLVLYFLLNNLINQTKISKGSSYGKTTPTTPSQSNSFSNLKQD